MPQTGRKWSPIIYFKEDLYSEYIENFQNPTTGKNAIKYGHTIWADTSPN